MCDRSADILSASERSSSDLAKELFWTVRATRSGGQDVRASWRLRASLWLEL